MPLSDGYQTERSLNKEAEEIAEAITQFLKDMGTDDRRGFILLHCDMLTGVVQYISDLDRHVAYQVVKFWVTSNRNLESSENVTTEAEPAIRSSENNNENNN